MDILLFIGLFLWLAFWSAQSGRSMNTKGDKLQRWQDSIPMGHRIPEFILGITFGGVALWGWDSIFGLVEQYLKAFPVNTLAGLFIAAGIFFVLFIVGAFVAFVGKESATVYYLPGNWDGFDEDTNKDGAVDFKDGRKSTMRPFNDAIAKLFGIGLSSKWYPKIWAFTKGLLISIPIAGMVAPFMPITRHIAIRAGEFMRDKYGHEVNFYAEFFGDGLAYAIGLFLFISIVVNWPLF